MDANELARLTGESVDELHRWQRLGLLPAGMNGDAVRRQATRVRLIQFARRRGIEPDRIAAALADQPDLLTFIEEQANPSTGRERSLDKAAAEAGIDPEFAMSARHAAGLDDQPALYDEVLARDAARKANPLTDGR